VGWALFVAFLVVPVVEIYVIVQVGQVIGAVPTVVLLLLESLLGAWIVKREGTRAWAALRDAVRSGQLPSRQLADAALVLVGGTLLLTPGFVTDVVGFFFVLPPTRPLARRLLALVVARRAARRFGPVGRAAAYGAAYRSTRGEDRVVPGEVVADEPPEPGRAGEEPPDTSPGRTAGR
jgi:UPF0716 protein FxsA